MLSDVRLDEVEGCSAEMLNVIYKLAEITAQPVWPVVKGEWRKCRSRPQAHSSSVETRDLVDAQ